VGKQEEQPRGLGRGVLSKCPRLENGNIVTQHGHNSMRKGLIGVNHEDFVAFLKGHGKNVCVHGVLVWLCFLAVTGVVRFISIHSEGNRINRKYSRVDNVHLIMIT
jgi:hypothetical protein